ncbi:MAG: hypothetical protein D6725_10935 [Planctomycetota bacterium]|nr:MAG: hypothetical protein D6725_10935 [Planctomycetota bacterium]
MMNTAWYTVSCADNDATVRFTPAVDRFWPPEILARDPFRPPGGDVERITLTGPGAVWMYAHAAAVSHAAGLAVRCDTPRPVGGSDDLHACESRLVLADAARRYGVLEFSMRSAPPLSQDAKHRFVQAAIDRLQRHSLRKLLLIGRASVDVYARLAATAIEAGVERLGCWSARDGLVVVWDHRDAELGGPMPLPDWARRVLYRPELPVVIGVVGDPGVGKSVLSQILEAHAADTGLRAWRLDCDAQSPTPPWYISLLATDAESAAKLREQSKRPWTEPMETRIAGQLRTARELFDVLIADLPGGDHSRVPPERVSATRVGMFQEVDAFIVLGGSSAKTPAGWLGDLRELGLDDRVAAVLMSEDSAAQPSLRSLHTTSGPFTGTVTGLDRRRLAEIGADGFIRAMKPGLITLWQHVLAHARRIAGRR